MLGKHTANSITMKTILGLDIGTNSIGWALIDLDFENEKGKIHAAGSRIIPTDATLLGAFSTGQAASKNEDRTQKRGMRRMRQRYKLRRERLVTAMKILDWLPADFKIGNVMPVAEERIDALRAYFGASADDHCDIPHDWLVYFLKEKGLQEMLTPSELARILYHFNQRRGFKSNRKTLKNSKSDTIDAIGDSNDEGKLRREKSVERVKIVSVSTCEAQKGKTLFQVTLDDGRIGVIVRSTRPDWIGQELELEITTITSKAKEVKLEFRQLSNSDKDKWAKQKLARELAIAKFQKEVMPNGHVSSYYLNELKKDPTFTIKDIPIDRSHYENEIRAILDKQVELYNTHGKPLADEAKIMAIAAKLYPGENPARRDELSKKSLSYILLDDIIYFQRPLRSEKGSIANCRYEKKNYRFKDQKGLSHQAYYAAAPVSSPVFQEFRIWQTVNNIRLMKREDRDGNGRLKTDVDVSSGIINQAVIEKLYELFDSKESVSQKQILDVITKAKGTKATDPKYNVDNYLISLFRRREDSELPGNETKAMIVRALKRAEMSETEMNALLSDSDKYEKLWHILYSLEDPKHVIKALVTQLGIDEKDAMSISRTRAFKSGYGSLSQKAMKRLLPLMRSGKYWKWDAIDTKTQQRLERIFTGEFDQGVSNHVRELFEAAGIDSDEKAQGLMVPMAAYAVYGVHSEKERGTYDKPDDIQRLKLHELRNPIVEQVVNEALMLVKDIWKQHKERPYEIHIELSRDLKKNAKEREDISKRISDEEKTNKRIASILRELRLGNPQSIGDIERMKITEKQSIDYSDEKSKASYYEAIKFAKIAEPTKAEIEKYKLWASQNFRSPYSGKIIPLSGLFTRNYDVDHIIPKSRLFDDSFDNKVVVETRLNADKGQMTAMQFMLQGKDTHGLKLKADKYEEYVSKYFSGKKKRMLLSEDVPEGMINRQMVDTRYIGKKLNELLAGIPLNQDFPIITTSGSVTSELRHKWGLDDLFKKLLLERYERLDRNMNPDLERGEEGHQAYWWHEDQLDKDGKPTGKKILKLKDWSKRIDHRHHALDAIAIACTSVKHIKYLNDLNAAHYRPKTNEEGDPLYYKKLLIAKEGDEVANRKFRLPWVGFIDNVKDALSSIIVSYKPSLKTDQFLVGRKRNRITKFVKQSDGGWKKSTVKAEGNEPKAFSPYVRMPLGAGTNYGTIAIKEYEKNIALKKALQFPELIAKKALRDKIVKLLEQHSGDAKLTEQYLIDNPLLDANGDQVSIDLLQKTVRTMKLAEALQYAAFVTDDVVKKQLQKALSVSSGNRKDAAVYLFEHPVRDMGGQLIDAVQVAMPLKEPLAANRVDIGTKCTKEWIQKNVVSGNVRKALLEHLNSYSRTNDKGELLTGADVAFDAEGIETMNRNRKIPIRKVRVKEPIGKKYMLGDLMVQTAQGGNLFFLIYVNLKTGEHLINDASSIPLHQVVEARKVGSSFVEEKEGYRWFTLSPGDLVYVPEYNEDVNAIDWANDKKRISDRIYMVRSFTKGECQFIPHNLSSAIVPSDPKKKIKGEIGWHDKSENSLDGKVIKSVCIKLKNDRLGNVVPA